MAPAVKCASRNRKGLPCRNPAIEGKAYCRIHHVKHSLLARINERLESIKRRPAIALLLLIIPATYQVWSWRLDRIERKKKADYGVLESRYTYITNALLSWGPGNYVRLIATNGIFLTAGEEPVVQLKRRDGQLFVSAKVVNSNGSLVAEISDNEWKVNPNHKFDRNYTDSALEVRDDTGSVVLQVAFFKGVFHIAGQFACGDRPIARIAYRFITNGPLLSIENYMDWTDPESKARPPIPKLFQYPSELHFGEAPGLEWLQKLYDFDSNKMIMTIETLEICPKRKSGIPK